MTRDEDLERAARVPYRLLESVTEHGGGDIEARATTPNMLIQGDNLDALKSLLPFYAGKVKCIYIDPPYNTGSAFEHYDDNLEHSQWLSMMWPRLELLRELLSEDGSIWVTIGSEEAHYMKVILDESFSRSGFVSDVVWQKRTSPDARLRLSTAHDHIIVYGKTPRSEKSFNKIPLSLLQASKYKNRDDDPRGPWVSTDLTGQTGHATPSQFYTIVSPSGEKHPPPDGRCWALNENSFKNLVKDGRVWFGVDGKGRPRQKRYLSESAGTSAWSWWENKDVGHNQEAKKEINELFGASNPFDTPKPERLIQRILHIATNPGDLVLDSFLGSGTTAAVAHKMGRRWIGIEMGDHAITHCVPRLRKVIEGEQGGISKSVNWKGGGGFRFYKLGEPVFGADGRIREGLSFSVLASHVWFSETRIPLLQKGGEASPFLGSYNENDEVRGLALLYNGILGDKSVSGGNVLTSETLEIIRSASNGFEGPITIYGERSAFGPVTLERENITFRQTPYDVAAVRRS